MPAYPWLRWGQDQCQPGSHETHPMGEKDAQSTSQGEHPQSSKPQGLLSRGCAPIPPASTTDQDHSEETDLGALFHQPGRRPTTDRAVTATERWGSSPQYPGQARVTGIKCPSRGSGHKPLDQTEPLRGRHKKQEELGSYVLQGRDHKHRKCNKTRGQRVWCRGRGKIISYKNH